MRGPNVKPDTAGYYDAFAGMYDEVANEANWPAKADLLMQRAFKFINPDTVKTVLDLGAGTGHSVDAIRRCVTNPSRIVAVDISSKMLERLRARHTSPTVETVNAGIEDYIAGCQDKFDLITAMSTLEFVPDLPRVLGGVARLRKWGGVFAATYVPLESDGEKEKLTESPDIGQAMKEYSWSPEDIEQSLTSQGLTIVDRVNSLDAYELGDETVKYNFLIAGKL